MSVSWEVISFSTRAAGALDQQSLSFVVVGTLFLLLAPLCENPHPTPWRSRFHDQFTLATLAGAEDKHIPKLTLK